MRSSELGIGSFRPRSIAAAKASLARSIVCLTVVALTPFTAGFPQSQIGNGAPYPPPQLGELPTNRTTNPMADANRVMEDSMKRHDEIRQFEWMNAQRQKEMISNSAKLIELAQQLNAEANKNAPDALSILGVRQAEAIEKLAHNIQGKMRESVSPASN